VESGGVANPQERGEHRQEGKRNGGRSPTLPLRSPRLFTGENSGWQRIETGVVVLPISTGYGTAPQPRSYTLTKKEITNEKRRKKRALESLGKVSRHLLLRPMFFREKPLQRGEVPHGNRLEWKFRSSSVTTEKEGKARR